MTAVPAGWDTQALGDVLRLKYGKALDATLRDPNGAYPVVGSAGRMTGTHEPLISDPAVLIGRKGNVGAVQLMPNGCWPIDTTYYAPIPDLFDPRFLQHQLIALDMKKLDSSTTTPSLRRQDLEAQTLVIPPLNEQRRIVVALEDHLSRIDAADSLVSRSIKRLAAFRDIGLSTAVEKARESPLVEMRTLGDLAKVSSGMTPLKGNRSFYDGGTVPWITSGDLHQGTITKATHFVTQTALEETTLKVLPAGTLLVAMYGEGKTRGTAAELRMAATVNQACAAVQLHDPGIGAWVRLVLDANYTKLRRLAAGGVQPNLNLSIVRGLEVPVPVARVRADLLAQRDEMDEANKRLLFEFAAAKRRAANLRHALRAAAVSGRLIDAIELPELEGTLLV